MNPQPMIVVADVEASSAWYQSVLGISSGHGGSEYERLMFDGQLVLQLHSWDVHEHPHLGDPARKPYGNGAVLWFQTDQIEQAYDRAIAQQVSMLEPLHLNPNANHREFWMHDLDGYVVVVAGRYGDV